MMDIMYELSSVEGVVEVKEEDAEQPDEDEQVVDQDAHVLLGLLDLPHQPDRVDDEHRQQQHPRHDRVIDPILQEVQTQQAYVSKGVLAIPYSDSLLPMSYSLSFLTSSLKKLAIPRKT